jgi:putative acetyltransferase
MFEQYQNYLIRSWQPGDRLDAAKVIENALTEYGLGWEPQGADRDVFWVIENNGIIIGTSAYYPYLITSTEPENRCDRAIEIRKMYLHPNVRGKGLGRYLLGKLEQAIFDRGYREIRIETASVLTSAVKLYESNGYQPVPEVETLRCDRAYVKILR